MAASPCLQRSAENCFDYLKLKQTRTHTHTYNKIFMCVCMSQQRVCFSQTRVGGTNILITLSDYTR